MKQVTCLLLVASAFVSTPDAQRVTRDIPYATAHERQVLDVYAPDGAKNLPLVFSIHGGGWQAGDKSMVGVEPTAFMQADFVFQQGFPQRSSAATPRMRVSTTRSARQTIP